MYIARFHIKGEVPYSQTRPLPLHVLESKAEDETSDAFDKRVWREKVDRDENGIVFIPPMAIKRMLEDAARGMGLKIKGRGNDAAGKYANRFKSGLMCIKGPSLGIHIDEVNYLDIFTSAPNDKRKRIWRRFPIIEKWECDVEVLVTDDRIEPSTVEKHVGYAGRHCGLGYWRASNGGLWGRFIMTEFSHEGIEE